MIQHTLIYHSDPNEEFAKLPLAKLPTLSTSSQPTLSTPSDESMKNQNPTLSTASDESMNQNPTSDESTKKQPTLSTASDESMKNQNPTLFTPSDESTKNQNQNPTLSTPSDESTKKQPSLFTPSDSTTSNISTKRPLINLNAICSDHLAGLGVVMPPGMVLQKSSRWIIPLLTGPLMAERESIVAEHEYIKRNVFIVLLLMAVWLSMTIGLSIWKPYYASLGIGFWLAIIHSLGSVIYLCYLRKKDQALEKFRAELTELVLKYRMKLPMVKVDDVKADQPGTDLINMHCYLATYPVFSNLDACIKLAVVTGLLGLVFCGEFYLSAHSGLIFCGAVAVINATICFGHVALSFIKHTISFGRSYLPISMLQ